MQRGIQTLRAGVAGLAMAGAFAAVAAARAQSVPAEDTARSVQRLLQRLPYYGVFDYLVSRVDGGTVYLSGYSFDGRLGAAAEMAVRRARGVTEVSNRIEALPASAHDDGIRWATFYRIYTDDFLSRYVPGGVPEVLREIRDERRFPGMQPVSRYPIHITVRNGRTMLLGAVSRIGDSVTDIPGAAPGSQGAKSERLGMRERGGNAARRDAPAVICRRISDPDH